MSTSLRLSFAKMRENFRWADLVSGNLKEEQGRSLRLTVAFEWPSAASPQLVVSIRHRADPAMQVLGSVVYLWRKHAQMATVNHSAYSDGVCGCTPYRQHKGRKLVLADVCAAGLYPRARASAHTYATPVRSTLQLPSWAGFGFAESV